MPERRQHLLLVNPSAAGGRALKRLPAARTALEQAGVDHRVVLTRDLRHGCDETRRAAEAGETVLVMSGDGLVGQVGGVLANTGVAMGIVPGGRGNDLARVLGIPDDPEAVARIVAGGVTREIDVGEANGTPFLGIASCGFDSDANRIANESRVRGPLVYAYAALRALVAWKPATFTLELDGRTETITGYSIGAANSKMYGGGMLAFPAAELDDGLLDVGACSDVSKLRFLRGLTQVFKGEHLETLDVRLWKVPELSISADRDFTVYADGDPIAELPARIRLIPRALRMLVPAPAGS